MSLGLTIIDSIDDFPRLRLPSTTKVISFDIFDTLLIRLVDPPVVLKALSAAHAVRHLQLPLPAHELLKRRRTQEKALAEAQVESGGDGECSAADVFAATSKCLSLPDSVARDLLACELAVEQTYCRAMPGIASVVDACSRTHRVIAISDTYLPESLLWELLRKTGLADYFSAIYPSCHYGLSKGSGRLFEKVLEVEGIEAAELLHVGDNFLGDYFSPRRLGIRSILLRDRENLRRKAGLAASREMAEGSRYWHGASLAATICSAPAAPAGAATPLYLWGRTVIGPLLANFTHLLCLELQESRPDAVLFLAREGYLLQKLYRMFSSELSGTAPAESGYLCVSRYTAFLAAISEAGQREVEVAFSEFSVSLDAALARFGIADRAPVQHLLDRHGWSDGEASSKEAVKKLVLRLLDDPDFQYMVAKSSRVMRDGLHGHLEALGFFGCSKVVLVDIGWFGGIQDSLEACLGGRSDLPDLRGYYLALEGSPLYVSGKKRGLIHDFRSSTLDGATLGFFKLAFEFSCRAPHGTTIGYLQRPDGVTVPRFKSDSREKQSDTAIREIHRGIMDCAREYLALVRMEPFDAYLLREPLLKKYCAKVSFPDEAMVKALSQVVNSEDFGSDALREIASDLRLVDFLAPKRLFTRLIEIPWREAALKAVPVPGVLTAFYLTKKLLAWRRVLSDRRLARLSPEPSENHLQMDGNGRYQLLRHRLLLARIKVANAAISALIAVLRPLPPAVAYSALLTLIKLKQKVAR